MVNLSKIKELAKDEGITIKSLAIQVGVTEQGLHKMIKDNSASVETLDRISAVLGVNPSIFFENSNDVELANDITQTGISAEDANNSLVGTNIHHNNINNSAVLMKALNEISEHRKLISESHKNLTEITKAVVKLVEKNK